MDVFKRARRGLFAAFAGVLVVGGCGEPLTNDIFAEDEDFRAALPTTAEVSLEAPQLQAGAASRAAPACEGGDLYRLTFNTMAYINSVTRDLLLSIESAVAQPITTRTEDSRVWGPHWAEAVGAWIALTVERRQVREADQLEDRYFYWLSVSKVEGEAGDAVLWGEWDPAFDLRRGVGEMTFDQGFFSALDDDPRFFEGLVTVTYDTRGERWVMAFLDDLRTEGAAEGEGITITCEYQADGQGGGWFTYENRSDIVQQTSLKEELEVTSRWLADGSGRSEGRYADGDLGITVVSLVECWDEAACTTFYRDTYGLAPTVGQASQCVLDDVVIP